MRSLVETSLITFGVVWVKLVLGLILLGVAPFYLLVLVLGWTRRGFKYAYPGLRAPKVGIRSPLGLH